MTPSAAVSPKTKILEGIKVLDLTRIVAGPWCTQMLADLGATVWKVERPGEGDDTRRMGPAIPAEDGTRTSDTGLFMTCNRGKKSITVDIADPEGAKVVRSLAAKCDVVVENYKAGGLVKYGLDEPSIRALNPSVVYCSVTGFGATGPYAARPAYDFILQGMSGLMSTCGHPDGVPTRTGIPITDLATGLYASSAILGALFHRERTGEGQFIDTSLLDCAVSLVSHFAAGYFLTGIPERRAGNSNPIAAPANVFPTSDGFINLAAGNNDQFRRLVGALGLGEMASDPKFRANADRIAHREELHGLIGEATSRLSTDEAVSLFEAAGVPCGPINDMAGVFRDPQVRHRGIEVAVPHESGTDVRLVRNPIVFSKTPITPNPPPTLGQHTDETLRQELGLAAPDIAALRARGAI